MKKRLMSILICVLLLVMVIPGVANAAGPDNVKVAVRQEVTTDNQYDKLVKMVDKANQQIAKAVAKAQSTPYDDVDELLATVEGIVAKVMAYADSIGAVVVCEYTTYYIDGQYVMIDPLRVIPL